MPILFIISYEVYFNMKINETQKQNISSYKWIKIVQAVLLLVLGAAFILIGALRINKEGETNSNSIAYCVGVALSSYGIINMISGYLLYRRPLTKEILMGLGLATVGITAIIKPNIITNVFPFFLIVSGYGIAIMLTIFGVEKIIGKEVTKNITIAVLLFVLSALIIALATTYIIFKDNKSLLNYILVILGFLLLIIGLASIVLLLIKVRNTNKIIKEQEIEQQQMPQMSTEVKNKDTKIIDLSELKKHDRKVNNKQTAEIKKIQNTDGEVKKLETSDTKEERSSEETNTEENTKKTKQK